MNDLPDVIAQLILEYRDEMEECETNIQEYKEAFANKENEFTNWANHGVWTRNGEPMSEKEIKRCCLAREFRAFLLQTIRLCFGHHLTRTSPFYIQLYESFVTFMKGLDNDLWLIGSLDIEIVDSWLFF